MVTTREGRAMSKVQEMYAEMGIERQIYEYGESVLNRLVPRFKEIDEIAEYNQMKVIKAMQDNRVSAECFNSTRGYGYNDLASCSYCHNTGRCQECRGKGSCPECKGKGYK